MAGFRNVSFDDRQTDVIKYGGPNGTNSWFLTGNWNATAVQETGTLSSANRIGANLSFVFPVPASGFYYYGIPRCCGGFYAICIDCNPEAPNFIPIDGVNGTDNGQNPPALLFSMKFDKPGIHEIILQNLNDTRFGKSQITLDRFDLEVPLDQVPDGATTTSPNGGLSTVPTGSAHLNGASSSNPQILIIPIVVTIVVVLLLLVGLLLLFFILRSRRRKFVAQSYPSSVLPMQSQGSIYSTTNLISTSQTQSLTSAPPSIYTSHSRSASRATAHSRTTSEAPSLPSRATDAGVILDSGDQPQLPPDYHQVFQYRVANPSRSDSISRESQPAIGMKSNSGTSSTALPKPEKF